MNTLKNLSKRLIIAAISMIAVASCAPKKDPYRLLVTVVDPDGIPVQNALVYYGVPIEGDIIEGSDREFIYTNIDGEALFTHPGKAVIEVIASKAAYRKCDVFELEMGLTEVIMTIYPWEDPRRTCQ